MAYGAVPRSPLYCAHRDRAPDAGLRVKRPVRAAGLRVEREHLAALAGDEQASADDRRLRTRRGDARETERPLQLQPRHERRGEAALVGRHVAGVGHRPAEAVPVRSLAGIGHRRRRRRCSGRHLTAAAAMPNARPATNSATAFFSASLRSPGLAEHVAGRQRRDNRLRGKLAERSRLGARVSAAGFAWQRRARLLVHRARRPAPAQRPAQPRRPSSQPSIRFS